MRKNLCLLLVLAISLFCLSVTKAGADITIPSKTMYFYKGNGAEATCVIGTNSITVNVTKLGTNGNFGDVTLSIPNISLPTAGKDMKTTYVASTSTTLTKMRMIPELYTSNWSASIDNDYPVLLGAVAKTFVSVFKTRNLSGKANLIFTLGGAVGNYVFTGNVVFTEIVDTTPDLNLSFNKTANFTIARTSTNAIYLAVTTATNPWDIQLGKFPVALVPGIYEANISLTSNNTNPLVCELMRSDWVAIDNNKNYCLPYQTILAYPLKSNITGNGRLMFDLGKPGTYTINGYSIVKIQ